MADGNITNQATVVKITVPTGFVELCMAVTAGGDTFIQVTEVKMTMHIGFV